MEGLRDLEVSERRKPVKKGKEKKEGRWGLF
jgi:hypothetical protein